MIIRSRTRFVATLLGAVLALAACDRQSSMMSGSTADRGSSGQMAAAAATMAPLAPSAGGTMVDGRGMAVYRYDRDTPTRSNCTGRCARDWQPVVAPSNAVWSHEWTTITRADGTQQWVYQGHPLYTSVRDRQAGEANGAADSRGQWHLVTR